jgi:hypothetical protein
VKHTKPIPVELSSYYNFRYRASAGGLFRLPKGKSPMVAIRAMRYGKEQEALIECMYIKSGRNTSRRYAGSPSSIIHEGCTRKQRL